MLLLYDEVVNV